MQFVLVHGAWHGGWCWSAVAGRLRARGHDVWAPTLTGVCERSHLASPTINVSTHIADVANVLLWNDLKRVVLVGHSYGGLVITGVASQLADRIAALVYLDAFVPNESGQCLFDLAPLSRVKEIEAAAAAFDGWRVPPSLLLHTWASDPGELELLRRLTTPHPIACFREPVALSGAEREVRHKVFLLCELYRPSPFWTFYDKYAAEPGWRTARLASLHDAMLSVPDRVTEELCRAADDVAAQGSHAGGADGT
jgi:pimeloyl-ACP methyl ester carboxylesterase